MFGFLRGAAQPDGAQKAVDRTVAALHWHLRQGEIAVKVADVLELLGAGAEAEPEAKAPARDPLADPLTGCASVLPQRP
ncbi:MAG TPA: hypothetical protein VL551_11855 [Actinospica sp.]|nr:hypothetical protein [Actinospica sp.]